MQFSIIIPTRDRPVLFKEALNSVLSQTATDFEVIVVNDGSDLAHTEAYTATLTGARAQIGDRLQTYTLIHRPQGHGPSYALNYGVSQAKGDYVGFLDDDDLWTDKDHLARASSVLADPVAPELYMSNQAAFMRGSLVDEALWLASLAPHLIAAGSIADEYGNFIVTRQDLLATSGFCHLNGLIVRRDLFERIGGMDETIRWEGDRDLYLRLIDVAQVIIHNPHTIARHNIPDPLKTTNMTTAISALQKRLSQLRVVDKAATLGIHADIRGHAREHRGYVLDKIAQELDEAGDRQGAAYFARQAFAGRPSAGRWLLAARSTLRTIF